MGRRLLLGLGSFLAFLIPTNGGKCTPGVLLPVWIPQEGLTALDRGFRGAAYLLGMVYIFLGVSIVSDRFMAAIEVITSKQTELRIEKPSGEVQVVVVRVWNETVANLTLMALGSSAPEILLSVIEIMGKLLKGDFESGSGELGPGTIVGSAAFNLLIIIAICIYVIPAGEMRTIKHLRVFFVTAAWSVFAYVWLLIILTISSPGVVDIWEGVVTFCFFPITVITAYVVDRRILIGRFMKKTKDKHKRRTSSQSTIFFELSESDHSFRTLEVEDTDEDEQTRNFEKTRLEYMKIVLELRKRHPSITTSRLEGLAAETIVNSTTKSRAFYRVQAIRKLFNGPQNFMKNEEAAKLAEKGSDEKLEEDPNLIKIFFEPAHYTVMENIGSFQVFVSRNGGDLSQGVMVDYKSEDGTANEGSDYLPVRGTLTFAPHETQKSITVTVIDDEIFEEDEHFYIRLTNPRLSKEPAQAAGGEPKKTNAVVKIINTAIATIIILDNDHQGVFGFQDREVETADNVGKMEVHVKRWTGARGRVAVGYVTVDGTAIAGRDYEFSTGKVIFEDGEAERPIELSIIEYESMVKNLVFSVKLTSATPLDAKGIPILHEKKSKETMSKAELIEREGYPKLSEKIKVLIRIKESHQFKTTVDRLLVRVNAKFVLGTSSWKEQFMEAITAGSGDDEEEEEGDKRDEEAYPSCFEYVMHFLTLFWKVVFALIPPTDLCGGYPTFVVSIAFIGILTALVGDLAGHFGCSVGLRDSVTAITFVALGTSIPDTFASKVSAVQDEYADASIGNVTGSNAVNVFLGIGIAWSIAAIAYAFRKCEPTVPDCTQFKVDPGSLGFSVTLFCTCAVVAIAVILIRRLSIFGGGELGGPARYKFSTALLFISLWLFYVTMSTLEAYGIVKGF